jgi:hypothetical protein
MVNARVLRRVLAFVGRQMEHGRGVVVMSVPAGPVKRLRCYYCGHAWEMNFQGEGELEARVCGNPQCVTRRTREPMAVLLHTAPEGVGAAPGE